MSSLKIKQAVRLALEQNDLDGIVALVTQNRSVLSQLIRAAYDKETLAGWRAIRAIGRTAEVLVVTDYEYLRVTIRKLLWSLSDESGGIGWASPEILGEIVRVDPDKFSDIIPLIAEVYDVEEKVFRPGVVYALFRIAEVDPLKVVGYQKIIIESLADRDALVKIYALNLVEILWKCVCVNKLWNSEYIGKIFKSIEVLKKDGQVAWIYKENCFIDVQVGDKANVLISTMNRII